MALQSRLTLLSHEAWDFVSIKSHNTIYFFHMPTLYRLRLRHVFLFILFWVKQLHFTIVPVRWNRCCAGACASECGRASRLTWNVGIWRQTNPLNLSFAAHLKKKNVKTCKVNHFGTTQLARAETRRNSSQFCLAPLAHEVSLLVGVDLLSILHQ